jgi:hypothetical protein
MRHLDGMALHKYGIASEQDCGVGPGRRATTYRRC